jgi:alkanesulfonate monooxygenase SsuD/methylene tetrahydromethanopterin reductase-like flavin-dependent oxidoreductase (luciferase family)
VRISVPLSYAVEPLEQVPMIVEMERAGLDAVWVAETWGYDAASLMGYLAAVTSRIEIGAGVFSVYSRSPALIAQTAGGVDALSNGRCILGLGTSGPQVVEGFHGVPFDQPMARLRERWTSAGWCGGVSRCATRAWRSSFPCRPSAGPASAGRSS